MKHDWVWRTGSVSAAGDLGWWLTCAAVDSPWECPGRRETSSRSPKRCCPRSHSCWRLRKSSLTDPTHAWSSVVASEEQPRTTPSCSPRRKAGSLPSNGMVGGRWGGTFNITLTTANGWIDGRVD